MNTRDLIQYALLREDHESIIRLLRSEPPLSGYDRGSNLAHLAAVAGKPSMIRLVRSLIGDSWDALLTKKNDMGHTPCDIVIEIGRMDLLEIMDESHEKLLANQPANVRKKPEHPYAKLSIEEEREQARFDAAGRKNQQKLNANANGKPFSTN